MGVLTRRELWYAGWKPALRGEVRDRGESSVGVLTRRELWYAGWDGG
ncbi:MAG: hypothetical protein L3J39_15890 [Verrucomicrobiales bacterium]|nr:hypothetical protein [Verrucomicrobiales bacterium]